MPPQAGVLINSNNPPTGIFRTANARNAVKSLVHPDFWKCFSNLPAEIQRLAKKNYLLWRQDIRHPSLHLKPLGNGLWSARIGAHYRAVGYFETPSTFIWIWIGSHEAYNKL